MISTAYGTYRIYAEFASTIPHNARLEYCDFEGKVYNGKVYGSDVWFCNCEGRLNSSVFNDLHVSKGEIFRRSGIKDPETGSFPTLSSSSELWQFLETAELIGLEKAKQTLSPWGYWDGDTFHCKYNACEMMLSGGSGSYYFSTRSLVNDWMFRDKAHKVEMFSKLDLGHDYHKCEGVFPFCPNAFAAIRLLYLAFSELYKTGSEDAVASSAKAAQDGLDGYRSEDTVDRAYYDPTPIEESVNSSFHLTTKTSQRCKFNFKL